MSFLIKSDSFLPAASINGEVANLAYRGQETPYKAKMGGGKLRPCVLLDAIKRVECSPSVRRRLFGVRRG